MASIPCYAPTNIRFTYNLGILTVEWDGSAVSYNVARRTGNGPTITVGEVYGNTLEVEDLVEGTQYGFFVSSRCGSDESLVSYRSYIIPSSGAGATNLHFISEGLTSAKIGWDGPDGSYVVRWGIEEYIIVDDNSFEAEIAGLNSGQNYTFYIDRYVGDYRIQSVESLDKKAFCCSENTV